MSATIKRINPRRPFQLTAKGLKRIVLGQTGEGAVHVAAHRDSAPKPLRLAGAPASHILVIAHSDRGALDAHAHQAIAAAALLADATTAVGVLVLGELTEDLSPFGADRIFVAAACDKARFDPARELALASDLIAELEPRHILLPDSSTGDADLGRRLAARLAVPVAAHVVELRSDAVACHWQGGAKIARHALPRLILLDPDTTDIDLPFRGAGDGTPLDSPAVVTSPYADRGMPAVDATQLDLEEADFIVAAGNGVTDIPAVLALAKTFDAAIGASRVAVDDGRFRRDQQVGATGKTVSANVYLAIGISGAVQHLQGIRSVRHVIAINTDASAPIAGRADLTVVDDAQAVMTELLEASRGRNFAGSSELVAQSSQSSSLPLAGRAGEGVVQRNTDGPPPSIPPRKGEGRSTEAMGTEGGTDRVPGALRVLVLAALGRNPVTGAARPNRDDLLALELARTLGETSVLHAGNPDQPALGDYLAYGASILDVIPAAATDDIASTLAGRAGGYDLILTGTRAEGGQGSGLVPYLVAERLGWPIVANALDVKIDDGYAEVMQTLPKGQRRRVRVRLPAVIAVDPRAPAAPHYAYARRRAGQVTQHAMATAPEPQTAWQIEPAAKRPVKFKAKESKAGHARMLSAIVAEARGGAVVHSGSAADKAQAILAYLRTHKLIDW